MENYESKLLSLDLPAGVPVSPVYSSAELFEFVENQYQLEGNLTYFENALKTLAGKLPFKIAEWPKFGGYGGYYNNCFQVEVTQFDYKLFAYERGQGTLIAASKDFLDAAYEVFRVIIPDYTPAAEALVSKLDRIEDQRLMIWLRMGSEIVFMFQICDFYGWRSAHYNVAWMCQELVRMGSSPSTKEAFKNKNCIIHNLALCGFPVSQADEIYSRLAKL